MSLLIHQTSIALWEDLIKHAESNCSVVLKKELEIYLITLLARYADKPEMTKQILATQFLEALHSSKTHRRIALQHVGDQCLLFAGLFPKAAEKRHVKIRYFIDLGQSAYAAVSKTADDLYWSLALQFVGLMDVLQCIRTNDTLSPLEAYELWEEVGSRHALQMLKIYTNVIPFRNIKRK